MSDPGRQFHRQTEQNFNRRLGEQGPMRDRSVFFASNLYLDGDTSLARLVEGG